ncbi:MAG: iron permease [Planctomycetaceae bacterium]|nr:MAG: iron permease [Planctomycetaceae bacterium]
MWPLILVFTYCLLVALASLFGGTLPSRMRLTHTEMQTIMSFVGGLVLGVGLLHMIPHSVVGTRSIDMTVGATLLGLLTMFVLIRIFQVHQHAPVDRSTAKSIVSQSLGSGHVDPANHPADHHRHADQHSHDHSHVSCTHTPEYPVDGQLCDTHRHAYSWIGLGAGLALHTIIDGMALAASVVAASQNEGSDWQLLGVGTFLAVLLHKPLDAMSITSVMVAGGWSSRAQTLVNLLFASMCLLGAAAFFYGLRQFGEQQDLVVGVALGFAAGVFLCISLADILPEIQFHTHDRIKLTSALLLGVLLAYLITFLEPGCQHDLIIQPASASVDQQ